MKSLNLATIRLSLDMNTGFFPEAADGSRRLKRATQVMGACLAKAPCQILAARNPDSRSRQAFDWLIAASHAAGRGMQEAFAVCFAIDAEGMGQTSGAGAQVPVMRALTSRPNYIQTFHRLQSPQKDEPVGLLSFNQNIEQPVDPIVEIHMVI